MLYSAINLGVLPAWILLFAAPRAGITVKLVHSGIYPVVYGSLYVFFMARAMFFGFAAADGGLETAAGVSAFFSHPNGVIVGWLHYLVFDLFIGAWIGRDAMRRGISHFWVLPCQIFTFVLGPVGLLAYFILRKVKAGVGFEVSEV